MRLEYYERRRAYMIGEAQKEYDALLNKLAFVSDIVHGHTIIFNVSEDELEKTMARYSNPDVLLSIPARGFTKKRVESLKESVNQKKHFIIELKKTSERQMWVRDLNDLIKVLPKGM